MAEMLQLMESVRKALKILLNYNLCNYGNQLNIFLAIMPLCSTQTVLFVGQKKVTFGLFCPDRVLSRLLSLLLGMRQTGSNTYYGFLLP